MTADDRDELLEHLRDESALVAWTHPRTRSALAGPPAPGSLLTAEQLGQRWQVPATHCYRLAREGVLPHVRLGRYVRFRADLIEEWEMAGAGHVGYAERNHISDARDGLQPPGRHGRSRR